MRCMHSINRMRVTKLLHLSLSLSLITLFFFYKYNAWTRARGAN